MRTLQKWKESWESVPRTWFLQESWWIHTQTPLLYENRRISPDSLSKIVRRYDHVWNEWNGLLYFLHNLTFWPGRTFVATTTAPFFASGYLPRHPLASNRLFWLGRTFVAMATFRQKEIGYVLSFPAMATFCGHGDRLLVFGPFCVSFICSSLDHFFSAQMG